MLLLSEERNHSRVLSHYFELAFRSSTVLSQPQLTLEPKVPSLPVAQCLLEGLSLQVLG